MSVIQVQDLKKILFDSVLNIFLIACELLIRNHSEVKVFRIRSD